MLKRLSRALTELRRRRKAQAERRAKAEFDRAFRASARRIIRREASEDAYRQAVNMLTNWQRNQWARAGRPGEKDRDATLVLRYLKPHPKALRRLGLEA